MNILPRPKRNFAQKLVDRLADFFGSWPFIIALFVVVILWVGVNTFILIEEHVFDPHPFNTLSFYLVCLATIQVPIILMSQNRQTARFERKIQRDYELDLKTETEIKELHAKLDKISEQLEKLSLQKKAG